MPDATTLAPALPPLIVDLDGTLIRGDTLAESLLRLTAAGPAALPALAPALAAGRAAFKRQIARLQTLDPATLAYHADVLDTIEAARESGQPVYLVTAADQIIADAVAAHLGLFTAAYGSDGARNLKGPEKAAFLLDRFGPGGFDYIGDSHADLPVWRAARRALVVAPSARLLSRLRNENADISELGRRPGLVQALRIRARALRVHQWAKNVLVLVPVFAAHRVDALSLGHALMAMLAFCFCASSVYVVNDMLDLPHDRQHPTKRKRPLASGALPIKEAPFLAIGALAVSLSLAALLPWRFAVMLAAYYACTLTYSLGLKRLAVWDVMMLAGLYTLRIFAGTAAAGLPNSPWLLAFSLFLFFCLAVVKRLTELDLHAREGRTARISGRGYSPDDIGMLRGMAASSGYMAVLVLALYFNSAEVRVLYRHPSALWALCPALLFWISRVLMLSHRGEMHDDPVVFALSDRISLGVGAVCLAAFLAGAL